MVVSIKDNLEKRTVLAQVNQPLLEETILKSAIISSFATKKKKRFILYESVDSLQPVATFTRAVLQTYR